MGFHHSCKFEVDRSERSEVIVQTRNAHCKYCEFVGSPSLTQERRELFPLSAPGEEMMVPPHCPRRRVVAFPLSDPVEELMVPLSDTGVEWMVFPSLTQERSGWFPLSDPGEEWMVPPL